MRTVAANEMAASAGVRPDPRSLVCAVIVNFNSGDYLSEAVASVLRQDVPTEVVVVDNRSTDNSLHRLRERISDQRCTVVELDRNYGFAYACNIGIATARAEHILLLNPDCLMEPGALRTMRDALASDPAVGMIGPRLVNPDGTEQRGGRRDLPTPWQIFCVALQFHRLMPNHPRFRSFNLHESPLPRETTSVHAISGACMLVRRHAVDRVGLLDPAYFLHFEDLDWCLRFAGAGYKVLFVPEAVVRHRQGVCGLDRPFRVEFHKHRSLVRYLRKNFAAYYPSVFMVLVSGLVGVRFGMLALRMAIMGPRARPAAWDRLTGWSAYGANEQDASRETSPGHPEEPVRPLQ